MSAKLLQQERREHKIGFTLSSHTREIHSDMIKGLLLKGPKYFAGIFEADFRGVLKRNIFRYYTWDCEKRFQKSREKIIFTIRFMHN